MKLQSSLANFAARKSVRISKSRIKSIAQQTCTIALMGATTVLVSAQAPVIVLPQNNSADPNPLLATPCYVTGDPLAAGNNVASEHVLVVAPYTAAGKLHNGTGTALSKFANADQIGSTWGLAASKASNKIYAAAVLKRHVALGPNGLGAIYVSDLSTGDGTTTAMTTSKFVDLVADLSIDVGQNQVAGMNLANGAASNSTRGIPLNKTIDSLDAGVFPFVGKVGLGDLDLDESHQNLFVVNLHLKKIHKIRVSDASLVASYDIPSSHGNAGTTMRPWGIEIAGGKLYAGTVYTKENSATLAAEDLAASEGVIVQLDLASGTWASTPVLEYALNYPKGEAAPGAPGEWRCWQDDYSKWIKQSGGGPFEQAAHYQPLISDMVMDSEGAIHIAMMDRGGHQIGHRNREPDDSGLCTGFTSGDVLRTFNDNGTIVLENDGSAGSFTSSGSGTTKTGNGGVNAPQGPGSGEFYWGDQTSNFHSETSNGGITMLRNAGEIVLSIMDPIDLDAGGWSMFDTDNGALVRDYQLYQDASQTAFINGKANGTGDMELVGDPIANPCEITEVDVSLNAGSCNDNGTPADTTDDYYTASVSVTFADKPATGTLVLSGVALHSSNTVTSVAVGSTTSATTHTFSGVRLKANGVANNITAAFSDDVTCTLTVPADLVPPCSTTGGGCCPQIILDVP